MGTLWQPGCLRTRSSWRTVLSTVVLAHRSTLLTTMKKGTFRAKASPRCSRVVPAASEEEAGGRGFGRKEKEELVLLPALRGLRVGESQLLPLPRPSAQCLVPIPVLALTRSRAQSGQ